MLVLAQVLLSTVLAVAAAAKLADRAGTRDAARDLGLPAAWGAPIAWGLPAVELALAGALLAPAPVSRVAALAAVALLLAFAALLARGLLHGRRIECRCFGRLGAGPVGWSAVARNALLATVALFVAAGGRAPAALLAAVLVAAAAMLAARRRPAVRPGAPAPPLALRDVEGRDWTLDALPAPLLLVFAGAGCGACHELLPTLAGWEREHAGRLSVAVVSDRPLGAGGPERVLLDPDGAALSAFGITATPTAVLLGDGGRVLAAPAAGADAIAALVEGGPARAGGLGRRGVLRGALAGAVAVTVLPAVESAWAAVARAGRASGPRRVRAGGGWLCRQRYALCSSASCRPVRGKPDVVVCRCTVRHGYSFGYRSCEERAPTRRRVVSTFALPADEAATARGMTCPERGRWANCLDMTCTVDRRRPDRATCRCRVVESAGFRTFGGNCDTATCSTVVWSAAAGDASDVETYMKTMADIGRPVGEPIACPAPGQPSPTGSGPSLAVSPPRRRITGSP